METVRSKKNEIDMTSGNLFKKIFQFSLPLMLSGVLQLLYNAADLIVCGEFGSNHSVAAISATNSLINLIIQLFLGLSVGANVLMARCYGANNKEKGSRVTHSAMVLSLIIGVVIGVFGMCFSKIFLQWMGTPDDVIDLSAAYLIIYFAGLPFSMIYNFGASLLRATGDTKRPFYYLAFAGIVNVLLNLLLVIVFNMDVPGVAISTVVAQAISALLVVICLKRNTGFCKLYFKQLKLHKHEVIQIIQIGLPAGIQGSLFSLSNVLIQSSINSLGTYVMDGNGASSSLEGFVYVCMNSIAQACVAFVSANYGAQQYKNMKKSIINATILVFIFGASLGAIMIIFGNQLLSIYIKDPISIEEGYKRLVIFCSTYFLCGFMDTFAYGIRGMGYSMLPTIVSLCGICITRLVWIYVVFPIDKFHTLQWLSVSYPLSWLLTGGIHLICLLIIQKKTTKKIAEHKIAI